MRIFDRLSRRLSIILAGVMACSTFAVPVAPAITAYAATVEEGQGKPSFPDDYGVWESAATGLRNASVYTDASFEYWGSVTEDGKDKVDYYYDSFKMAAPMDGTLQIHIECSDVIGIGVWKKGDTKEPSVYATPEGMSKGIGSYTLLGNGQPVTAGDYYMYVFTTNKDAKFKTYYELITKEKVSKPKASSTEKKSVKATIKKVKGADGYEFAYGTNKSMKVDEKTKFKSVKAKSIKFDKKKLGSYTLKKLKSGKKYWVRVRTYVIEDGVKYYSNWSAAKLIKVK
jgi:hypothetical protein